ncbi:hypothetical protein CNEONATNEC26_01143 [Clostridium neonatale]|nr:hypothetical protein CNEONATNEC26_01143 [Clostridium neonatale]
MISIKIDVLKNVQIVMEKVILSLENIKEFRDINAKNAKKLFLKLQKLYGVIQKKTQKNGLNLWN